MKLIEFAFFSTKNANTHLLVSCLLHDRVNWRREVTHRKRDRDLVVEKHLWHDLSSFTCCLSHILKGRKAAVWTQCSLLRPKTLSGQREGEQLAESGVVTPPSMHHLRKTSCPYPVSLALDSLPQQQCDFWLWHMKNKTSHDLHCSSCQGILWAVTHIPEHLPRHRKGKLYRFIAGQAVFETHLCTQPACVMQVGRKYRDILGTLCFCTDCH